MNAHSSYLRKSGGYDLVVAITADAVNATMKQYLSQKTGVFTKCYITKYADEKDPGKNVEVEDFEKFKTEVTDPFSVSRDDSSAVEKLMKSDFAFAFRAGKGLPAIDPPNLPDIIRFDKNYDDAGRTFSARKLTYQLYCPEFQIVYLGLHHWQTTFYRLEQPPVTESSPPWIFSFDVNLAFQDDKEKELPKEVLKRVKDLNPDSMFSVQSLYLVVSNAGLQKEPKIPNLETSSEAYETLQRFFLNAYWNDLHEKKDVLLGSAIRAHRTVPLSTQKPSIIPTDLGFLVSPYISNDPKKYGLYTLNYLVMSEDRKLPASPQPFAWNWVDESEVGECHGTMAVNKVTFVNYFNTLCSAQLREICVIPECSVRYNPSTVSVDFTFSLSSEPGPVKYDVPAEPADGGNFDEAGKPVLSFKYERECYDESAGGTLGSLRINCRTESNVYFERADNAPTIRIVTRFVARVQVSGGTFAGGAAGNVIDYELEHRYPIQVTSDGTLSAVPEDGILQDRSERLDPSTWSEFVTLGTINALVDSLQKTVKWFSDKRLMFYREGLQDLLENSTSAWVFPAGMKTFTYKRVGFSDHNDLVVMVTYREPNG